MKYNTIVIGGGLAGLIAGATLTKFGKKVLLLEQHYKPGGCATTFKRDEFIIEVALHEMSSVGEDNSLNQIFKMLEVDQHVEFLQVPDLYAVHSADGKFVFPHGFETATRALVEKYPKEEKGIKRFMKLLAGIRADSLKLPRKPRQRKLIYPLMPLLYPNIVEATKHTVGSWLDKHIDDEKLKLDLAAHVIYYGDDPYNLSMFYFGLPQAGFIGCGGHYIKGGSQNLSSHLASFIEKNGGTVLLGKKARKIITRNGRAAGVTFIDRYDEHQMPTTIECDNVVANCAIPLVPELLDEPFAGKLRDSISSFTTSCGLLCLYLGFDSKLDAYGVEHYSNYIMGEDVKRLKDVHPNQRGEWSKRSFIFVDYTQVDAALAPEGKSAGVICAVDYLEDWDSLSEAEYKAKKEEVEETLLQRLEKQFPGIRESIVYSEIATSKTMKRFTSNPGGTPYGFTQSRQQAGLNRPRNNFLIPNLYFASAWAFPGGGFEGTIMGGFLAALQMNKDRIWSDCDGDKFIDKRIVRLVDRKEVDGNTIELSFEKPEESTHEPGQYAVLRLLEPKETKLDLPYRWLKISSAPDEPTLKFQVELANNSFSRSCRLIEKGDKAVIFGLSGQFVKSRPSNKLEVDSMAAV